MVVTKSYLSAKPKGSMTRNKDMSLSYLRSENILCSYLVFVTFNELLQSDLINNEIY